MNLMFIESDATNYIVKGDIAIIRTEDDHKYYLAKLTTDIYEAEKSERVITTKRCLHIKKLSPALTCSYLPEACNFIKKETLAQVFSCQFCEISKNTFLTEHPRWLLLQICVP